MNDDTAQPVFATTHWSVIIAAREKTGGPADESLAWLCRTYWPPLYAFLRRQGSPPAEAEDLVQGFFERFLARDYLGAVDADKGRFRSFLLKALQHYAANQRRNQRTQRRGGGRPHLALDEPGVRERCEGTLPSAIPPELHYDRVWAQTIMANALRGLEAEYAGSDRAPLFAALQGWLAREARPGEYAAAAPALGMTEGALAAAVFRLRRRFRERVRAEVAHTVQSPDEIDAELRHLLNVLTA